MDDGDKQTTAAAQPPDDDGLESHPKSVGGRIWAFVRIMNVRLRFIFLMVLVGLVVGYWENITNYWDRWTRPQGAAAAAQSQDVEYYCPMHPNIVRAEPGNCPICGMPLSKRAKGDKPPLPDGVLAQVQLTPQKVNIGRIGTSPVTYQLLTKETRTVGIVDYDETRRAFIAARIKGRIDKLLVNYVGQQVKKGDPLAQIYSPDLLVAQEELLTAERNLVQENTRGDFAVAAAQAMVDASEKKLQLWGITDEQIKQIIKRGTPETHLTIYSPIAGIVTEKNVLEGHYVEEGSNLYTIADLSHVWMEAKVFENEIEGLKIGSAVEVTATAYPNTVFAGRIAFIAYTVDPATRTVSARVEIENPDYKLKPGMYASAAIRIPIGKLTETQPAASAPAVSSAVVREAALDTRDLARAYLAMTEAYAQDKTDEAAIPELIKQAKHLAAHGPEGSRVQASVIAEQAGQLKGERTKAQRKVIKAVSDQVIAMMRAHPPAGLTLYVAHCPMVNADWLQSSKGIKNPYYGQEMPRCGEITGSIQSAAQPEDARFASGYFCPIYPDRLFEKPELCPIDEFPMKYVRIEKVLAVPVSAVIDTGTRQIVYRESSPGSFDMVEVKLGPRAGEYYPVLSGLKADEKVATVGAFLVDAENRLNPAAGAQYFGASGGPSGGDSGHKH